MRPALQTHQNLRGHLHFPNQLIRADLHRFQNPSEIVIETLQEALYEELVSQIQFFGISNVAQFLAELEKQFAKRAEISCETESGVKVQALILCEAGSVSNIYESAKTRPILHAAFRTQKPGEYLHAPRIP